MTVSPTYASGNKIWMRAFIKIKKTPGDGKSQNIPPSHANVHPFSSYERDKKL